MRKHIIILCALLPAKILPASSSVYAGNVQIQKGGRGVDPGHSNIYVQKITNESSQSAFIAIERIYTEPMEDRMDISGHLMPGKDFQLADPEGTPYAMAIPLWKKTFRGSTFNVITLSGNPGRIYYLYTIDGHLWAIKAPRKEGDIKGIHLLDPAQTERRIELKILDNNMLSIEPLEYTPPEKKSAPPESDTQKTKNPQVKPGRSRPVNTHNNRSRRETLPRATRTTLQNIAPD